MNPAAALKSPLVRRIAATLAVSTAGLVGIVHNEGTIKKVYPDPVGIPTVCTGHTGTDVPVVGTVVSDDYCILLLQRDTKGAVADVGKLVKVPVTQEQFDALVDFDFNVGRGNFTASTLLRKINAGDCHGAGAEFPKWNKARGRVLPGLTKRRAWERNLWESGC